ncbi:glycosyltransferase family 2 protein [Leucobacter iarius]|uniref:Glycosyltransferase 2-like domain-containing protein n=1 Tax=Leucobacter iarius TaxID=333963 RepID=A0ABP4Y053_9MICO
MSPRVAVSVVIPLGPDLSDLSDQLAALVPQRPARGGEIILSCNAFNPEALRPWLAQVREGGWSAKAVDARARRGPSPARNIGWRAAESDLILFCDSDDVVGADWVDRMIEGLRGSALVGGVLELDRLNPELGPFPRQDPPRLATKFGHLPFAPSCALGAHRALLERLDGFDEELRCGEDIDLCWRAAYLGYPIILAPDAVLHYRLRRTARETFHQAVAYGKEDRELLARHRDRGARVPSGWPLREGLAAAVNAIRGLADRRARFQAARQLGTIVGWLQGRRTPLR